jgi:hypothetical protein
VYRILNYSSDGECAVNLQEMLEMSIGILRGLAAEHALLHHIDESWFEFETAISDVRLWSSSDIATRWSQKVINALQAAICAGSCGGRDP